ncbi:site-specific integrase [Alteribacillus sp. JSM 102045]|uniref:site-specific integrase n=1 Tax=Alteribacillus sp. JSM 102045 TaxID=1562101 RepID=UPI0035C174EC
MNFTDAVDDYLLHLEVEKNYSKNTLRSYAFDLKCFQDFLRSHDRSENLDDLSTSTSRRFIQDQVLNHEAKPQTLQS